MACLQIAFTLIVFLGLVFSLLFASYIFILFCKG